MSISENVNTIAKIEIVPVNDVASFPPVFQMKTLSEVSLKPGKSWRKLYFTPDSVDEESNPIESQQGELWQKSLNWRMPKIEYEKSLGLNALIDLACLIRLTTQDGIKEIIGWRDFPVWFSARPHQPKGYTGYQGYMISLSSLMPFPTIVEAE